MPGDTLTAENLQEIVMRTTSAHLHGIERLLRRAQGGDDRAWAQLIERFQGLVASVPRRMGLPEEDVADVFQSTFVSLYESLGALREGDTLPAWLATTARRHAFRVLHRRRRLTQPDTDWETLPDDHDSHGEVLKALEGARVWTTLRTLGPPCDGLLEALFTDPPPPYEEVSKRLGVPVGAIGPTRARCLEKLRKRLMDEGFFEADVSERDGQRS